MASDTKLGKTSMSWFAAASMSSIASSTSSQEFSPKKQLATKMSSFLSSIEVRDAAGFEILGCVRLRTENLEDGFEDVTVWSSLTYRLRIIVMKYRRCSHRQNLPRAYTSNHIRYRGNPV